MIRKSLLSLSDLKNIEWSNCINICVSIKNGVQYQNNYLGPTVKIAEGKQVSNSKVANNTCKANFLQKFNIRFLQSLVTAQAEPLKTGKIFRKMRWFNA